MKILVTKDEHLQLGFRNKFRNPGWEKDIFFKHKFIINYMLENNIEYKLTTGDILDKQTKWSFNQYLENKKILDLYKEAKIKVISIAGNHDMMEGRQNTDESVFQEYVNQNLINHINEEKSMEIDNVRLHGIDYKDPAIVEKNDFFNLIKKIKTEKDKSNILVIHQNITPEKERVTDFTYDEISRVCKNQGINILICGHYHIGYPTINMNDVIIINPWNLWRVVRDYEVQQDNHTPEFVVIDINDDIKYEHVIVPHKKYHEAFNIMEVDTYNKIKKQFNFIQNIDLDIDMNQKEDDILKKLSLSLKNDQGLDKDMLNKVINTVKSLVDF